MDALLYLTREKPVAQKTPHHAACNTSVWQLILSDLNRYRALEQRSYLELLILCPGTIASIYYRIGQRLWSGPTQHHIARMILKAMYLVISRFVEPFTGISIAPRATIGPGLHINHSGAIIVGGDVVMGRNCNLTQGVTIGIAGRAVRGSPTVGDRVFFGPGSKVLGKITIGNDAVIGANAVVTKSVPERAVVVGIPAHVISYEGSFEFTIYDGMLDDEERAASLRARESHRETANTGGGS